MPNITLNDLYGDQVLRWLQEAENSTPEKEYREVSMEDYRFYAGKQDTAEGLKKLQDQRRPTSVYNKIKPKVDMLIGLAAQSKHDPRALPIGIDDDQLAELVTSVLKHYKRKLKLGRKELDAFGHMIKGGRSLLFFYINTENPYKPKIECKRINGRNFYIDPQSVEYDLSDARYVFIESWIDKYEASNKFPDIDLSAYTSGNNSADTPTFFNEANDLYRVVECWYTKYEEVVWFVNPLTGEPENLSPKEFKQFTAALAQGLPIGPNGQIQTYKVSDITVSQKKVWWYRIFSGTTVIEEGRSPYKWDGFPGVLYGAYRDEDTNCWFGVVKMMKDPQRAVNAMKRQLSHLLQTLPKGILVHESGAILNIEEYEKRSADPSFHLELSANGMGRYKFEQQPQISPIYNIFAADCDQSMKDASGIQNEMMGQETSSRTPGVTVRNRQETGLAVLFSLYDNFRDSRITGDRILLKMIQQYSATGELIRITGMEGTSSTQINTQNNPALAGFNDLRVLDYDIDIDEVSETTTSRQLFAEILADYARNNPGTIPSELILEYSDAPFSVRQKVKDYNDRQMAAAQAASEREYELKLIELQLKADAEAANTVIKAREVEIKNRQTGGTDEQTNNKQ